MSDTTLYFLGIGNILSGHTSEDKPQTTTERVRHVTSAGSAPIYYRTCLTTSACDKFHNFPTFTKVDSK